MKTCIIGAGNIGKTIVTGLLEKHYVAQDEMYIVDINPDVLHDFQQKYPQIHIENNEAEALAQADMIIIAVKPWQFEGVLQEVSTRITRPEQIIVSIVAGISIQQIRTWLDHGTPVVNPIFRVIPNIAASQGLSASFIATDHQDTALIAQVGDAFSTIGSVYYVSEEEMVGGTSLASCGIAFVLKFIDSMIHGGEAVGFDEATSQEIVLQTVRGALAVLESSGKRPQELIDIVTTPGGITLKGLEVLNSYRIAEGVREAVLKSR